MKNFYQEGKALDFVAGADYESGDVVQLANIIGIVKNDVLTGANGVANLAGVVNVVKAAGTAWAIGDILYWDSGASDFTETSGGNTFAGYAAAVADTADVAGRLLLWPSGGLSAAGVAAVIAALGSTADLTALVIAATTLSDLSTSDTYTDAALNAIFAEVETAFDLKSDNADVETLRTEVEARLDDIEAKIDAILVSLKNAGLMAT